MSHSVSRSEVDRSDPLYGFITGLSLTDMIGIGPVEAEPGLDNPFEAYLQEKSGERSVRSLDELARDVIPQHLAQLRQTRRFLLNETDDLYTHARRFQEKYGVSEASFLNWSKLLSGWIDFPAVLLLNPSSWGHLPADEMVEASSTLSWMRHALQQTQLTLTDVILLNMLPMVTNELLKSVEQKDRPELVQDTFTLAIESLRYIQPRLLISCQCSAKSDNEQWSVVDNDLGQGLCSSVAGAQLQHVHTVDIGGHTMQVVQGIHPHYVVRHRPELHQLLERLFVKVFQQFGEWKSQREASQQELRDRAAVVWRRVLVLVRQMRSYQQICRRAAGSGS
ncbi:hypothetical protein BJX76DRAFT_363898 [Aspergillus varians]